MTIDVDAVYENGILTLKHPVDLPENAEVHVTIQTAAEARTPLGRRLRELRAEIARSGMAPDCEPTLHDGHLRRSRQAMESASSRAN